MSIIVNIMSQLITSPIISIIATIIAIIGGLIGYYGIKKILNQAAMSQTERLDAKITTDLRKYLEGRRKAEDAIKEKIAKWKALRSVSQAVSAVKDSSQPIKK